MLSFMLLFFSAFLAGMVALLSSKWKVRDFKRVLVFAGSYLFSITILHIFPELFADRASAYFMGLYVLLGFLLQQVLVFMSSGIEHGHIHDHAETGMGNSVWTLMVGLFLHAFLEGTLLSKEPSLTGHHHGSETLLLGIVLHKIPEAFALVTVLLTRLSKQKILGLLVLFSLASPLGMLSTEWFYHQEIIGRQFIDILFGLVAGGFLHIATMIFFESSPRHQFQVHKLLIILLAAGMAILSEYLI